MATIVTRIAKGSALTYLEADTNWTGLNSEVAINTAKVSNVTHTGDVTGATILTIAADIVDNAKLANVPTATLKGRVTATTGDPEDLTVAQAKTLLAYTAADVGAITASSTETLTNKTLTDPKILVSTNAQTGVSYTLVLADASKFITMNNAAANSLIIPLNSVVAFPIGTVIVAQQIGAGATTLDGAVGVTLNSVSGGNGLLTARWSSCSFIKTATDTWFAMGQIGTVA